MRNEGLGLFTLSGFVCELVASPDNRTIVDQVDLVLTYAEERQTVDVRRYGNVGYRASVSKLMLQSRLAQGRTSRGLLGQ